MMKVCCVGESGRDRGGQQWSELSPLGRDVDELMVAMMTTIVMISKLLG